MHKEGDVRVRKNSTIKHRFKIFLFILVIFPVLCPDIFSGWKAMSGIYQYIYYTKYISILLVTSYYLFRSIFKHYPFHIYFVILGMYFFVLFVTTMIHQNGDMSSCISIIASALIFLLFCTDAYYSNDYTFFETITIYLTLLILINLLSILLYPDGVYSDMLNRTANWFLGYKNRHIYTFIPAFFFGSVSGYLCDRKYFKVVMLDIIMAVVSTLFISSMTTVVCVALYTVAYMLLVRKKRNGDIFKPEYWLYGTIVLSVFIIFFNIQNYFAFFIEGVLGKDLTFTTRTTIWNDAIRYIEDNLLLGNGLEVFSVSYVKIYGQCHNRYLDSMYVGGLVGFTLFIGTLLYPVHRISKYWRDSRIKNEILVVLSLPVNMYFILFLVEAQRNVPLLYAVFFVLLVCPKMIIERNKFETKR